MSFWSKMRGKHLAEIQDLPELTEDDATDAVDSDSATKDLRDLNGDEVEVTRENLEKEAENEPVEGNSGETEAVNQNTAEVITSVAPSAVANVSTEPELSEEEKAALEEIKLIQEAQDAEEKLRLKLEAAESSALEAQLDIEQEEYLEDLTVLDGRVLPQLKVPDWREELEFVKERYEPCDLSDHIVKVSKRRLTARQIDHELIQSRLSAYERYLERASRRFKDKIDEDALLKTALSDLAQWRVEQGKSVAWLLVERINEEVLKARKAEQDATTFVENNITFTNRAAVATYRHFSRRLFIIPITTLYIMSVVGLTYSKFEWIMKFFPLFNLGLAKTLFMIGGVASYFMLANFWRYSKKVAKIQKELVDFNDKYQEQEKRIRHAVSEHTRLSQQQPLVEPKLQVMSKGYRVQLQSDVMVKVNATTDFDSDSLPACVTLAKALVTEEEKMNRLNKRALNVLMAPGWRTDGLNEITRIYAISNMLDAQSFSLKRLDTDSMVSTTSAQKMLLDAFGDASIHNRVSREKLIRAIVEIHREVLANWDSDDRPNVSSLRNDGFDKISFRTSWLADEDTSEPWINFLEEILSEETAPFGDFSILDKRSDLTKSSKISSVAVIPHYFEFQRKDSRIKIEQSKSTEVLPIDVVVRVDVSPWADTSAFAVFADDLTKILEVNANADADTDARSPLSGGGFTGA